MEAQARAQDTSLQALRQQYKSVKEQVADKQTLLLQEQRIQSLSEHRHALQPGQPCPLCGAHEHPAVAAYEALDASATEAALRRKQDELDALQTQGETARATLAATTAAQAARQRQADELEQDIARWHDTWNDTWQGLAQPLQLAPDSWQQADTLAASAQACARQLDTLKRAVQAAEQGEQAVQQAKDAAQHSRQSLQTAQGQLALQQQALADHSARREELQQSIAGLQAEAQALNAQLQASLGEAGHTVPDDAQPWLEAREAEWQHWQQARHDLQQLAQSMALQRKECEAAEADAQRWKNSGKHSGKHSGRRRERRSTIPPIRLWQSRLPCPCRPWNSCRRPWPNAPATSPLSRGSRMPCKASSNRPRPRWPASARKRPRPNPHGRPPWPPAPLPTNPPTCRPCCPHPNASAWSRCASNCRRHNSALPPCSKPHSASTRNCRPRP